VAQVVRFDRSGKQMENIGPVTEYRELRLSPDGQKIAYSRFQRSGPQTEKLWLLDLTSGVQTSFSADMTIPAATSPVWSADGSQVFYGARPAVGERFNVYRVSSRSAEKPELLLKSDTLTFRPLDISRDGRFLLIGEPTGKADLWFATLGPETKLEKLLVTPFREREGRFSPDGLWVAYTSDESGNDEVYIRAFPSGGNKIRISTAGGRTPVWRRDGSEVAYLSTDSTLMSVTLKTNGDSLKPLTKALFKIPNPGIPEDRSFPWWEMTGDGQFFYVIVNPALPPITVILNWTGELNSKN
jgi:serine/threonine-protein kinase